VETEEEIIELRQEVEDLRDELSRLSKAEERGSELRLLLSTLLSKVESMGAEEPSPITTHSSETEIYQEPRSGEAANENVALARDVAQMRDHLAGERALVAELRMDLENARAEARALLGGDIQGDLDVIRKEISAVQARVLRASLNGQI